ncbi:MAG: SpoIIE family protein phosphatase [Candidatus Brocadiia bacterium]
MPGDATTEARFEIRQPGRPGRQFRLDVPLLVIGRDRGCDIWLADAAVSRRHAQLQQTEDARWALQDLGSRNGTFVNGERTNYSVLRNGDTVRVGDCELVLHAVEEAEEESDSQFVEFVELETLPAKERPAGDLVVRYARLVRTLNRAENVGGLMERLAGGCLQMCGARCAAAGLFRDGEIDWMARVAGPGASEEVPSVPDGICRELQMKSLRFAAVAEEPQLVEDDSVPPAGRLLFPLRSGGRTYGLLYLDVAPASGPLPEREVWLVRLAAMEAGSRVARLRALETEHLRTRMETELDAARRIQLGLFPSTLQVDARLRVAAYNLPCVKVSGDYYDVLKLDDDRVLFVLADAMGHGLAAALLAANFQAGFRLARHLGHDLVQMHSVLNELVEANAGGSAFLTGVIGSLDLRDGALEMVIAGHPPPLRVREGSAEPVSSAHGTGPWGMPASEEPHTVRTRLAAADTVLIYTDGVTDAFSPEGERYSASRLQDAVAANAWRAPQAAAEAIAGQVVEWSSSALEDDVTLFGLNWLGQQGRE